MTNQAKSSLFSESSNIDFRQLSELQPEIIGKFVDFKGKFNFKDPHSQLALSRAILKLDFGIDLLLDTSRLIPPIPNRMRYLSNK
jgi:23S rRNA (adenine1618-N6)-methyltransferase